MSSPVNLSEKTSERRNVAARCWHIRPGICDHGPFLPMRPAFVASNESNSHARGAWPRRFTTE